MKTKTKKKDKLLFILIPSAGKEAGRQLNWNSPTLFEWYTGDANKSSHVNDLGSAFPNYMPGSDQSGNWILKTIRV